MYIGCEIWFDSLNRNSTSRLLKMICLFSNCGNKTWDFKVSLLSNHKISQHPSIKNHPLHLPLRDFGCPIVEAHSSFSLIGLKPTYLSLSFLSIYSHSRACRGLVKPYFWFSSLSYRVLSHLLTWYQSAAVSDRKT